MHPLYTVTVLTALSITQNTLSSVTGLANVDPAMGCRKNTVTYLSRRSAVLRILTCMLLEVNQYTFVGQEKIWSWDHRLFLFFRQMIPSAQRVCPARSSLALCLQTEFQEVTASSHHCCRVFPAFYGAMAKLRKSTISFVMSVQPSVHIELYPHRTDFHEIWYLSVFSKICQENPSLRKIGQE